MYVCVCNAVTERDVKHAVASGCQSLRDLRDELGVASCCGRCACAARELLPQQNAKASCLPITFVPGLCAV